MTLKYSNEPAGDRRRASFLRWPSPARSKGRSASLDPEFVVDRRQLYKYLDSLEGLSGE